MKEQQISSRKNTKKFISKFIWATLQNTKDQEKILTTDYLQWTTAGIRKPFPIQDQIVNMFSFASLRVRFCSYSTLLFSRRRIHRQYVDNHVLILIKLYLQKQAAKRFFCSWVIVCQPMNYKITPTFQQQQRQPKKKVWIWSQEVVFYYLPKFLIAHST